MMAIGEGLGLPLPLVAGAVLSGAYFGDKLSPLSDSTVLAASMAKVEAITITSRLYSMANTCKMILRLAVCWESIGMQVVITTAMLSGLNMRNGERMVSG